MKETGWGVRQYGIEEMCENALSQYLFSPEGLAIKDGSIVGCDEFEDIIENIPLGVTMGVT